MTRDAKAKVGVGLGVAAAAAAAAAAGYYFYASEGATKNRRIAAKWAGEIKDDIVSRAKKLGTIDRAHMMLLIDQAAAAYETARSIDRSELSRATQELRDNWEQLVSELRRRRSGVARAKQARGAKTAKKAAKRAGKKRGR